jgi:hypothetical protein
MQIVAEYRMELSLSDPDQQRRLQALRQSLRKFDPGEGPKIR